MAPYTQLYVHYVWSTWERLPIIEPAIEPRLYGSMRAKCQEHGCAVVALGGVADHVHLLIQLATTITIARLVAEVKGASSHVMNHEVRLHASFKWQQGYGAFTISKRTVPIVQAYVLHQKQHHAAGSLYATLAPPIKHRCEAALQPLPVCSLWLKPPGGNLHRAAFVGHQQP